MPAGHSLRAGRRRHHRTVHYEFRSDRRRALVFRLPLRGFPPNRPQRSLVDESAPWKNRQGAQAEATETNPTPLSQAVTIRDAKEVLITFFCYCALEQTAVLWASAYVGSVWPTRVRLHCQAYQPRSYASLSASHSGADGIYA